MRDDDLSHPAICPCTLPAVRGFDFRSMTSKKNKNGVTAVNAVVILQLGELGNDCGACGRFVGEQYDVFTGNPNFSLQPLLDRLGISDCTSEGSKTGRRGVIFVYTDD